jgi:hypothetical protein
VAPRRRTKVPFRNKNHTGWWVASFIQRFEYFDEDRANPNRRCLAWENTILVRASSRESAHDQALKHGHLVDGSEMWDADSRRRGSWRFEGLTGLVPVYEPLEDGAEILLARVRKRDSPKSERPQQEEERPEHVRRSRAIAV